MMMRLVVEIKGDAVWRRVDGAAASGLAEADPKARLDDWAERYGRAAQVNDGAGLLAIGAEMLDWLDTGDALRPWLVAQERLLEIRADPTRDDPLQDALLAAPWELLAQNEVHLAAHPMRLFAVARRCAGDGDELKPTYSDLALLFMAASPEGQSDLDYEGEETAILTATLPKSGGPPLAHLTVEESGACDLLGERCVLDGPFQAVHLSCHGDMLLPNGSRPKPDDNGVLPQLLMETEAGGADHVTPERLMQALAGQLPPLLFLSACRTAEQAKPGTMAQGRLAGRRKEGGLAETSAPFDPETSRDAGATAPILAAPFARQMAIGVANVLGWDGSVYDSDATSFARELYGELALGATVPIAAARARRALLQEGAADPQRGRHWHLARVYLGPGGGGALADPQLRNPRPARAAAEQAFLDPAGKRVPVARRDEFVGRRRALQRIIRALRGDAKGVLIHGFGNLGKSSLAARVAGRLQDHRAVVVFGSYHVAAIAQQIEGATRTIADGLDGDAHAALLQDLERLRNAQDPAALEGSLRRLLTRDFGGQPILLVIDDLHEVMETPEAGREPVEVRAAERPAIAAVLRAFRDAQTRSRLLVTSRYDFALPDASGVDLAGLLVREQLKPMESAERVKQWRAKARAVQAEGRAADAPKALLGRALVASTGNPGLQDILTTPLLNGETETAEKAIAAIERYLQSGEHPTDQNEAQEFFQRMSFETYAAALTPVQRDTLAAACLFDAEVPIPRPALVAAAGALGVTAPEPALDRLLALGLLDDWGALRGWADMTAVPHAAANALARPLAGALDEESRRLAAAAALPALAEAWRDDEDDFPLDPRGVTACGVALQAVTDDAPVLEAAALAAVVYLFQREQAAPAALALAEPALERLAALGHSPDPRLLGHTINAARQAGETELQDRLLDLALAQQGIDHDQRGQLLGHQAYRLVRVGELDQAEEVLEETLPIFEDLKDRRQWAISKGQIADIHMIRGKLDAALKIREEDELPVYTALGDKRSLAVTKGQIAQILQAKGELDKALATHLERLPVAIEMKDIDSIAHIRFSCAEIRLRRGDHKTGGIQTIADELGEAWAISNKLQRPDFIGAVGGLWGQVLAMGGHPQEGVSVLEQAAAAWDKLGQSEPAAQCRALAAQIEAMVKGDGT